MKKVSLFIPCLVDLFLPEIGESTIFALRHFGVDPVYHPEQTCCGQPLINAGYRAQAKEVAKHFISVFENDDVIVCPSGSCAYTVKQRYAELLKDEPQWLRRANELAPRVYELSQFICDALGVEEIKTSHKGKVAYHSSCQLLRGLGVAEQPKKLIRSAQGAELAHLSGAEKCCGFGGEFSVNYPEISEAMVSEKVKHYLESGADILVACEPGCLLNINGYLGRHHPEKKAIHIATFLADAIRNGKA